MPSIPPRTMCHWTAPNGVPASKWGAGDTLHSVAGSFSQPYEEWLADMDATAEDKPARDYRLLQLRTIPVLRDELERAEREAVERARSEGVSWADIGKALGVTRQAAQMRFGKESK